MQKKCIRLILRSTIKILIKNGANSCLFVNGKEIHEFKAKDSKIVATPLCLGNISKDWSVNNMKTTGFNGYDYGFMLVMMLLQLMIF